MLTSFPMAEGGLVEINFASAFWVLGVFLVVVVILYRTAWKHVLTGLKMREQRIRKDIADAEMARKQAEASLAQYNAQLVTAEQKVREILSQAASDAEKIGAGIRMRAQQEAEEAKDRATNEIETAKRHALGEIYAEAANLATAIAEKIIRRNLNPDDQRELVTQSLDQLPAAGRN